MRTSTKFRRPHHPTTTRMPCALRHTLPSSMVGLGAHHLVSRRQGTNRTSLEDGRLGECSITLSWTGCLFFSV
ncbi:hypothetical protein OE88DRAFT_1160886 [Heliocybe sulcata]|uniref:Uncharacterized protein n=1 Tax=Heliocybe sulcata TaxID=5364 RepID=A0A5C3NBB3_9AGAM|nr:hypothetical protein OE88DRAFT_1160886 [Heliocybe sulcata]